MPETSIPVIAGYTPLEVIGEGGMGTVFRALDQQTGHTVAIKCLKQGAVMNAPELIERFQREGEVLRRLNHPNIVQLLATIEEQETYYLVMEYVGGGSLDSLLKRQPQLPVDQVLSIALELTDALARAHHLHVIHRDIKPANILMAEDGTPRLTDFGVSRMINAPHLTSENAVVGTPNYLCPEALRQQPVDARCDIWALGVLLFQMLAGRLPFQGNTLYETMTAVLEQPTPDLPAFRPDVPIALQDLVYRMLEKEPAARIPSMRQVGAELEKIIRDKDFTSSPGLLHAGKDLDRSTIYAPKTPNSVPKKHILPVQTTAFIGRDRELGELAELLHQPANRLITLLGPGGIGKTRLSLEIAARHLDQFQDGVFFVPLDSLQAASSMALAIAKIVGLDPGHGDPTGRLLDYLYEKQALLVLDNFEHLLDGAALVTQILENAPLVKVLVSSREKLKLQEEVLYHIEGLDVPAHETDVNAATSTAVQLFLQGARRVRPGFKLGDDNRRYVVRICRLVEGMPLAILLAAAWVELLSPGEIADEITKSLDLLETDVRNIPQRHRSVRAVFTATLNQLSPAEQAIFARLSVFRGGFCREAAQAITQASLRDLILLVNKSLLRRDLAGRYSSHALLQQFAAEQLAEMEDPARIQAQHSRYYAELIYRWSVEFRTDPRSPAAHEIEADLENLRSGWRWAVDDGPVEDIACYVAGWWQYCDTRSWYLGDSDAIPTYERAIRRVIALPHDEPNWSQTLARLYESLGHLLGLTGQHEEAITHFRHALEYVGPQHQVGRARLYRQMGNSQQLLHHPADALRAYGEAEQALGPEFSAANDEWWHEWVQIQLERSWLHYWQNEWHEFTNLDENVRGWVEMHGTLAQQVNFFNCLGMMAARRDRYVYNEKTLSYTRTALEKSLESNNPADIAWSQFTCGMSQLFIGSLEQAESLLQQALTRAEQNRDFVHQARCLTYQTLLYRKQWLVESVRRSAARSLEISEKAKMPEYVGIAKANQAWVAWCDGNLTEVAARAEEALSVWGPLEAGFASLAWRWVAFWPLMGVALKKQQVERAIGYARQILDPSQQRLPEAVTHALQDAIDAWEDGHHEVARSHLYEALQASGDLPPGTVGGPTEGQNEALTARECEVLKLIAKGLSNEEVATQLGVGISTVKKHVNHIFAKLGVDSRMRAILRAKDLNRV
jgi:serine/threonine protein kinase/DNA-binding CsgD family transcriptional regulator